MKRGEVIRGLSRMKCEFVRHGSNHDIYRQPKTGVCERVPRHPDINENTAKSILRRLSPDYEE